MKCSYMNCSDIITKPLVCKVCNSVAYCSNNCRVQDFYKGHQKVCKAKNPTTVSSDPVVLKPDPPKPSNALTASTNMLEVKSMKKSSPLDLYEMTSKNLGTGAYGEVKLVKYKPSGELRALKTINKQSLQEEKISPEKIFEEIINHKELDHQNIIKYIDHFEDSTSIYIVLEYAENGSLFDRVKNNEKMPEPEAKSYFKQVVEGIQYLHLNDIIHRDIKPENILISSSNQIKICDFGWCVKGGEMRSTFCGTLDYMAPEMVKGQPHSFEVDVWALGVLLYEMLHGYPPFEGMREADKCYNIVNGKLNYADWISSDAKDLIGKMIQINSSNRIKIENSLKHPFFSENTKETGCQVGTIFRYYVQKYGMDEGVIEEIMGEECLVRFKKSGLKMKLQTEELERRIMRNAKRESKFDEIEGGKVAKIAQMFEKNKQNEENALSKSVNLIERKNSGVMDFLNKKLESLAKEEEEDSSLDLGKSVNFKDTKKFQAKNNSISEEKKIGVNKPSQKIAEAKKDEKKITEQKKIEKSESNSSEDEEKNNEKKKNEAKKNEEKNPKIENEKPVQKLEKMPLKDPSLNTSKKSNSFESDSDSDLVIGNKSPIPSLPKPEVSPQDLFSRLDQLAKEEESSKYIPKINLIQPSNLINSINTPIQSRSPEKSLILPSNQPKHQTGKSFSILSQLEEKPGKLLTVSQYYPPINNSESPLKSSKYQIPSDNPTINEPDKEYDIYNSLDAYIKAPVRRKKSKPKESKQRDKSLDKTLEKFKEKYSDAPAASLNIFSLNKPNEKKNQLNEIKEIIRSSSPKFKDDNLREKSPDFGIKSESSSEENIFLKKIKENMKKGAEKPDHPFSINNKEEPPRVSPKFPIDLKKLKKKDASFENNDFEKAGVFNNKELLSRSKNSPVKSNQSKSPRPKDFDLLREEIETKHGDYYKEIEEAWIDKQDVVKAIEVSDNEADSYVATRTFSQYDEMLKQAPSIVSQHEEDNLAFLKDSKDKLEKQKKELEEMIKKIEKEKNVPIRIPREKKSKDDFLSWLGNIIGCSERY